MNNNLYVITGGPGSGKTTLLNKLGENGFEIIPEEARKIIKEQVKNHGTGLPWKDKEHYAKLMFEKSIKTYQHIKNKKIKREIFFDRGILDTFCYCIMGNILISKQMETMVKEITYNEKIFILPPWREIYEHDAERKQSWEEAVFTYHQMKAIYLRYGYNVIEVPKDTVENRLKFVLHEIR